MVPKKKKKYAVSDYLEFYSFAAYCEQTKQHITNDGVCKFSPGYPSKYVRIPILYVIVDDRWATYNNISVHSSAYNNTNSNDNNI